jgi:hypothetical protein
MDTARGAALQAEISKGLIDPFGSKGANLNLSNLANLFKNFKR